MFWLRCRARIRSPHQGPSAVSSKGRRRAHHGTPTSLDRSNEWRMCANARCCTDQNRSKHLPTSVCPTSLAPCLSPLGHKQAIDDQISRKILSQQSALVLMLQTLQSFVQCFNRDFEVLSPELLPSLTSSQNVVFASGIIEILSPVFRRLHRPKGLRPFAPCCLTRFSAVKVQLFPKFPFNSLVNCLAESVPVASTKSGPHLFSATWSILMHAFTVLTSSALNVNSFAPSLMAASGQTSLKFGFWT